MRAFAVALVLLIGGSVHGRTANGAPQVASPASQAAAAAAAPASPATTAAAPELRTFGSARAALRVVLQRKPVVLGIGEYHQKKNSPRGVRSSLSRFTRELLPVLRRRASDLVIETWITKGNCGAEEQAVVEDVDKTTKRPEQTESEIVTLVKRAQRYKIRPHILEMTCDDYRRLLGGDGVNYETFLAMTADQLRQKITALTAIRLDPVKSAVDDAMRSMWQSGGGKRRDLVLAYGGALHNDLEPLEDMTRFSYARAVAQAVGGRYIELDVFVPEYIESDKTLLRNQSWFPLFQRHQSHRRVLLIRRSASSYVLIFRRRRPKQ